MKTKRLLIVALCGLENSASAQTPNTKDCESNPACVLLYEQAQQQSKAGQLPEALHSYKLAFGVNKDPRLLFSIARVLQKQGQAAEAVSYYRQFIASHVPDETQKAKAQAYVTELEPLIPPPPPPVTNPPASPEVKQPTLLLDGNAQTPPSQDSMTPVYKKGWFWGVIIGSVAAIGLGVGLGVGLGARSSSTNPTIPSGVNTYEPTF